METIIRYVLTLTFHSQKYVIIVALFFLFTPTRHLLQVSYLFTQWNLFTNCFFFAKIKFSFLHIMPNIDKMSGENIFGRKKFEFFRIY